jgi:hypothetical protein
VKGKVAVGLVAAAVAASGAFAGVAASPGFKPPCPAPTYSPDGNFSPLFCKIANPQALAFYGKLMPPLFRLGPTASPTQVLAAMKRSPYVTGPELCAAYHLAAFAEGWRFPGFSASLPMRNGATENC